MPLCLSRPVLGRTLAAACLLAAATAPLYATVAARAGTGEKISKVSNGSSAPSAKPGSSGKPGSSIPALASATLEQCTTAVDSAARAATFNGQMSSVPGTRRMAIQIAVQEQMPGDAAFHTLGAAAWSGWRRSEAGVKIYKYVRQVTDLPAPGAFRAIVLFRWIGERGRVIKRAVRRTPVCVQPDERPKLVVDRVVATPIAGSAAGAVYRVVVRNDGRSSAGAFEVALNVGGVAQPPLSVASLDAGARTTLEMKGPTCTAGSQVEVTLDPTHQVPEAAGGGQSDTLPCPLPPGP